MSSLRDELALLEVRSVVSTEEAEMTDMPHKNLKEPVTWSCWKTCYMVPMLDEAFDQNITRRNTTLVSNHSKPRSFRRDLWWQEMKRKSSRTSTYLKTLQKSLLRQFPAIFRKAALVKNQMSKKEFSTVLFPCHQSESKTIAENIYKI